LGNLRSSKRGSAPGPSGMTSEHLQVLLDNEPCSSLLHAAAEHLARAQIPDVIQAAIRVGKLTALRKPAGGVRGIVVGDVLRRLVARTMAQVFAAEIETATSPFQYALSTRAGTECVAHILQSLTKADPRATILSIDGIGAFDLIGRQAMLHGLMQLPDASKALPFVRMFYGQPSEYLWYDDQGEVHSVFQAEGGEQGDPLMPALYALGQHPALQAVQVSLRPGEHLFAFLDDVYAICAPERARPIFDALALQLQEQCGISINLGKTRVWNAGGLRPAGFESMGTAEQPVWTGDLALPVERRGLMVLGTPLGHDTYVARRLQEIRAEHASLLRALRELPELQSSWLLLSLCACPRSSYYLRALPPSQSVVFAAEHDEAILATLWSLLDHPAANEEDTSKARALAHLPYRLGGLGLRSAARLAQAAYWASWADCLPMIHRRHPAIAAYCRQALDLPVGDVALVDSLQEARLAREELLREGFDACPTWAGVLAGTRPPQADGTEPGEWAHGWQYHAASARDGFARGAMLARNWSRLGAKALIRSQSGRYAGRVFSVLPTSTSTTLSSSELRVLLLRRLQLPLPMSARRCACGGLLDTYGDHRAACSTCGVLRRRAKPLEKATARVCREAGARVAENVLLRDMNLEGISPRGGRQLEVVANGLPLWGGAQLAVDATLVSPVRRNGSPQPNTADHDGGEEAALFVRLLAKAKARSYPAILRRSLQQAYMHRWTGLLAVAAHRAFASTLLELPVDEAAMDGEEVWMEDVLREARLVVAPTPSRLPAP
jgi:hypothetical protein